MESEELEQNKLPLKRVELSLSKFNDVAIPHHLDLLRQHKANMIKYEELGDYARVRSEQTHARRVTSQLRVLLGELEALRRQVAPRDAPRFDALTRRSRDLTLRAIMDYLETSPLAINRRAAEVAAAGSALSTESVGVVAHAHEYEHETRDLDLQVQLQVDQHELEIAGREAVLRGWAELQSDVRALHAVWSLVHEDARQHRDQVAAAAASVDAAADNVRAGRQHLSSAEKLRGGAVCLGGALAGALAGGPLGLVLGAKAGAAAALAGSLLGYMGASVLRRRKDTQDEPRTPERRKSA